MKKKYPKALRWKASNTCTFNLSYHLVWCPKYRRDVLRGDIAKDLKKLILKKSKELKVEVEEINIMPDHVHLFVRSIPTLAPHFLLSQFKGYSSRILRKKYKVLRTRLPCLWTRSYYIDSVGKLNEYTIKKYIENQKL